MKKILFFVAMFTLLLLTACGGKAEDLQVQVDDLTAQVESLAEEAKVQVDDFTAQIESLAGEAEDLQGELDLAESAVGLCVASLEEEITTTSGLTDTFAGALSDLATCQEEVEALSIGPEAGGGGEGEEVTGECDGTLRTVMISTPVLQQSVSRKGEPRYNANGKMVMIAIDDSWIEGFIVGDTICVTKNYGVAGGWSVFLISGTRSADYNLFIPAHYLEPLNTAKKRFLCDPSYPDFCIPSPPPDLDCGDIPYENWNFTVVGSDPHGFDANDNGIGCEG